MDPKIVLKEEKTILSSLKTDPNSVWFSEEKLDKSLLKKTKNIEMFKRSTVGKTYTFSW